MANILRTGGRCCLILGFLSALAVLCLRWIVPPTSAGMLEDRLGRILAGNKPGAVRYQWVDWKDISPYLPLAVVAAEDQKFPFHRGFDVDSMRKAVAAYRDNHRLRGASTITQQVAKNLFLWPGRSFIRKGIEAYFTLLLEALWPKERILEVYVNIVQFGDGIYGVQAAATALMGKSPADLTENDAALLAAVLPNPLLLKVSRPSGYVLERRQWIREQAGRLGGLSYLKNM
ncbi:MAG: monofunctional biosynthetic peptidoglycan transglycosylase [Desulfocapsaceae bacterium]|nr:monofunctional biosynthetic peptidoglycan transglycosylase [Desulfocapsaceae bacterium]